MQNYKAVVDKPCRCGAGVKEMIRALKPGHDIVKKPKPNPRRSLGCGVKGLASGFSAKTHTTWI